jgi:hypothetical protein
MPSFCPDSLPVTKLNKEKSSIIIIFLITLIIIVVLLNFFGHTVQFLSIIIWFRIEMPALGYRDLVIWVIVQEGGDCLDR